MKLPSDYLRLVTDGARALRGVGGALRTAVAHNPSTPELWLSIRDVEGLADRLASLPDAVWRTGSATPLITGQDVGVLDELFGSPPSVLAATDTEQIGVLARLRSFLRQHCDGEFEMEEPSG